MHGTDYFQVIHGEGEYYGEFVASGNPWPGDKLEIGTMMDHIDETHSQPGTGKAIGYLTKKVTETGPTFEKMTLGYKNLEAKAGQALALQRLDEGDIIEVEGEPTKAYNAASLGLLVTSGTGAITGATATGTDLSVKGGRWYVAQSGDEVLGRLENQLDPSVAGNVRVRIKATRPVVKS